jgi:phage N-6-adenine-methyltransferase
MIVNTELSRSTGHLQSDLWETPPHIFEPLMKEFDFTLDPCCTPENAKCKQFFTVEDDGLSKQWMVDSVFVNPPYSRGNIDKWVEKCYRESFNPGPTTIVALLPVSTSSAWFHKFILRKAEIRFYKGRIRFVGAPYTAPFSSMLAIW